jgi:predicted RecB family nuclease
MQIVGDPATGNIIYSASDLVQAARCEYAFLRDLDAKLGIGPASPEPDDEMLSHAAELGDQHEAKILGQLQERYGVGTPKAADGVVVMEYASAAEADTAAQLTADIAAAGAEIIHQAVLFDRRMIGFADFLIRRDQASGFGYDIADAKLARHQKPEALLQIAAYAEVAHDMGLPITWQGQLLLGDGRSTDSDLARLAPVARVRRKRIEELIALRQPAIEPVEWDEDQWLICGRCPACTEQVDARRDLLLVAGMRMTQRERLQTAGVYSIDELAVRQDPVPGIPAATLAKLTVQAELQVQQLDDDVDVNGQPRVRYRITDQTALSAIPPPSDGDIFFDFEGDPMWQDPLTEEWGLEYLFGVVEAPLSKGQPRFRPFWAHDRVEEKKALQDFVRYVEERRRQHPGMRVYHYADYERAALLRLVARHGVCEVEIDQWLRDGLLVDLYPIVKRSLVISQPSYSIKKLEPLYMEVGRDGEVASGGDSLVAYAKYTQLVADGDELGAAKYLQDLGEYNEYDCVSTLRLRDWLLDHRTERVSEQDAPLVDVEPREMSADELEEIQAAEQLFALAEPNPGEVRSAKQQAMALMAAAVGYHRREDKSFWWEHFDRLNKSLDDMSDRGAMVVSRAEVIQDWHRPPRARKDRRELRLVGTLQPGSEIRSGSDVYLLYDYPGPTGMATGGPGMRSFRQVKIDNQEMLTGDEVALTITELSPGENFYQWPSVVAVGPPPPTKSIRSSLLDTARQVLAAALRDASLADSLPRPVADLLLRQPPRLVGDGSLPTVVAGDFTTAITEAVRSLDGSTLAVQGPPGTGKTYVGSHVIANLVNQGWRIGVVSQGHAAVNQMLDRVVAAGVDPERVGKKQRPKRSTWTELDTKNYPGFLAEHHDTGYVVGGTTWDFTGRVGRGVLDLLVVDEAGQFSLANTIAASASARNLLLLGDPQQLPQVSQGAHPEPVDTSALGWLGDGHTLPEGLGYFLDITWRMHPEITQRVSRHSYEGRLESRTDVTAQRVMLDGNDVEVAPGIHELLVEHSGNDHLSEQEAAAVVDIVREALSWTWHDPHKGDGPRPMTPHEIVIVAPFNAQQALIRRKLRAAELDEVRVGTVDKFQGQEAPLAIVSMSASSAADVPRGIDFLISPNRVNVAVSRAQWRAIIVRGDALTNYLPGNVSGMSDLGGFLQLTQ